MAKLKKTDIAKDIEDEEMQAQASELNIAADNAAVCDEDEVFELPAGYVDEEGTIHREFTLREINGKDEEAIHKNDIKGNSSKVAYILLSRCITRLGTLTPKSEGEYKWGCIIRNMLVGDQDYALLQLRKMSIGDEFEANHTCPYCKAHLKTFISVDELEIEPFKGDREITFDLIRGYKDKKGVVHKEGTMRLPNGLDREVLTPVAKTNLARAETVMLTRLCKFSDGSKVDEDVMGMLSLKDREYLQNLLKDNLFGVKTDIEVTCTECGESFTGSLNATNFM
jgi:hypothetical protein